VAKSAADTTVKEDVEVEVTGGLRRAAVAIEGTSIPLRPGDGGFGGSKKGVELESPVITMTATLKGGMLAKYDIAVTINGVTKHSKGTIREGLEHVRENWTFSEFKLATDQGDK
jgi:hypothetical protein